MAGTPVNPAVATAAGTNAQQSEFDFMLLASMVAAQRRVLKLNAKQASAAVGVDPSKLSTLKKGGAVSLDNVCRLCNWLQLPLDLFRVREMTPASRKRLDPH